MFYFRNQTSNALETLRAGTHTFQSGLAKSPTVLKQSKSFGPNPGNLRMFSYHPSGAANCALVVVLHGCGQTAAAYDHGAGWSTLADRYGFALLMPEQQQSINPNSCFNWFQPEDTARGRGEAASICQMVESMVRENGVDPNRVFITGLSAGGAMTSAMLACYPDVFAAGAIIAGVPYGAASNVQQAFESMFKCPSRSAKDWADRVRAAAPHHGGRWPRVSVWHGNADKTVVPSNAREIVKQWTAVHGLTIEPSVVKTVGGYPRQVWLNEAGEELIESYTIGRMAHGTPLATGKADTECGAAGPYLLDVGISSSFHIAKFFGLTAAGARQGLSREDVAGSAALPAPNPPQSWHQNQRNRDTETKDGRHEMRTPRSDIGAVINKALEAAGLLRRDT